MLEELNSSTTEMNIQTAVDQTGRVLEDLHHQALEFIAGNSDIEEPSAGELWEKVSPELKKALAIHNLKESPETPESSWIPGRKTKRSCQENIDEILDTVLAVLGTCGAAGYRTKIRNLQRANAVSQVRIAKYREQMLFAPSEESQNFIEGMVVPSKENRLDSIADETDRIMERNQQIEDLKAGFREHLEHIGIHASPETADSFLLPVEDDIIAMAAVISNIGRLTEQLQKLVEASSEASAETKKYYGMYLLLVFAIDRLQTHFVSEIDVHFLPRIAENEGIAARHVADAQGQIKGKGPKDALEANIAANRKIIEACGSLADVLGGQRRTVLDENRKVRIQEEAAVNTYRTVCLSISVAELIGYCQAAFRALRDLQIPALRPFQNSQLSEEMQRLAERVTAKE